MWPGVEAASIILFNPHQNPMRQSLLPRFADDDLRLKSLRDLSNSLS